MDNYNLPGNGQPEHYRQYQPPVNNYDITQDPAALRKRIKKATAGQVFQ